MAGEPEANLLARARQGEPAAVEALVRAHYDRVHALAYRLLGDRRDAEDASQEAMVAVVRNLHRFDGRSALSTWVYRIATNTCLDELRRRRRRPQTVELGDEHAASSHGSEATADDRLDLTAALAELPEEFRVAVVLRDVADLDYAEIAETLGIPAGTVRSRIARGRAALSARLAGNPAPPGERRREVT